ncbi:hypothetical protein HYH03_003233 [Edaphochlamys debaryana]|uniref:Mur ligase central domain-containing protein n=1 Tax=Edaphochlamys debaryana TaxID=47281 RepID=A0A836C4M1_9CHLO|nr:hypothetical protein HYH03_003233 [Edaphochlamys debaryana]|eukprot:KAG2499048.1 hypothetical protein HYH03_003233 [Edaphochlamys debaryana]
MLNQQLRSQLRTSRRTQLHAPTCSAAACPSSRQPVVQRHLVPQPCPAPPQQVPPRHRTVASAARGRPKSPAPPPEPEGPEEEPFDDAGEYEYDEEEDEGEGDEFVEQLDPLGRKLLGIQQPAEVDEDDEEYEEYEEGELEDEGALLDEAAEADRDGLEPDEDVGEPSTSYPEPPDREYLASDLFGEAGYLDVALWLASTHPDVTVAGVQSNPRLVIPGDVYVLHDWLVPAITDLEAVGVALGQGATVIVLPKLPEDHEGPDPIDELLEAARQYAASEEGAAARQAMIGEVEPDEDEEEGAVIDVENVPVVVRVDDVVAAGSRLAAAFYEAPARELLTVGVLGQAGKTTTSWLIRGILEEMGQTVGTSTSIEHAIAEDRLDEDGYLWEPLEEDPSAERESSVPFKLIPYKGKYRQIYGDALPGLNLQKLLGGMRDRGAGVAVVELEQAASFLGTYDYLDMNVAVVTHLAPVMGVPLAQQPQDRLEAARPYASLAVETLAAQLRDAATQALVVNADDPLSDELLKRLDGAVPYVTYGVLNSKADVFAESIKSNIWETEMIIRTPGGRLQIIVNLLGSHNAANVLAAVATGVALKAPLASIVAGIEAVEVPGRSEVLDEGQAFSVVVDSARTPEALEAMLDALRQGGAKQIFTVFGCSGNEDASLRPRMGSVAHAKSDYVILTNENPRWEDPAKLVSDIVAGFPDDLVNKYSIYAYPPFQDQGRTPLWFEPYLQKAQRDNKRYVMEDRYSAIRAAIGTAQPDDVVLLAGKGEQDWVEHVGEQGELLRGWLDDRVEARNALSKLKYLEQIPKLNRSTLPWGNKIELLMETLVADAGVVSKAGGFVDTGAD